MQTEDTYDDLAAQFAAHNSALESEAFVEKVMQPVRKRVRWRTPLLFGAGGIGVGAALSQIGGLYAVLKSRTPELSLSLEPGQAAQFSFDPLSPFGIAAVVIVIISCAAIVMTERA